MLSNTIQNGRHYSLHNSITDSIKGDVYNKDTDDDYLYRAAERIMVSNQVSQWQSRKEASNVIAAIRNSEDRGILFDVSNPIATLLFHLKTLNSQKHRLEDTFVFFDLITDKIQEELRARTLTAILNALGYYDLSLVAGLVGYITLSKLCYIDSTQNEMSFSYERSMKYGDIQPVPLSIYTPLLFDIENAMHYEDVDNSRRAVVTTAYLKGHRKMLTIPRLIAGLHLEQTLGFGGGEFTQRYCELQPAQLIDGINKLENRNYITSKTEYLFPGGPALNFVEESRYVNDTLKNGIIHNLIKACAKRKVLRKFTNENNTTTAANRDA